MTRNTRSRTSTNKRPASASAPADSEECSSSGVPANPISKVAKLDRHEEEEEEGDNDDGAVEAKEDVPPIETAVDVPPLLGSTNNNAGLPPLPPEPEANPTTRNESNAAAEVGPNDNDEAEDTKATDATGYEDENSQNIQESMPPLADVDNDIPTNTTNNNTNKKSRKERKEFTATEKLQIISEIHTAPSLQSVLDKYGVSKSSLHRWRQPEKLEQLQAMAKVATGPTDVVDDGEEQDGSSSSSNMKENKNIYRKRVINDKLRQIKLGLWEFCKHNMDRDEDERLAITSSLIKLKATQIKEDLLSRYNDSQSTSESSHLLSDEEFTALKSFQASKSWACQMGNHLGYLSSLGTSIQWTDKAKANTVSYLKEQSLDPPKQKKQRMEFTAEEKLAIVQELEEANVENKAQRKPIITVDEICRKYDTSKSSFHRWQQQYRSGELQALANTTSGHWNSKRIFKCKLLALKKDLHKFYVENEAATSLDKKVTITFAMLQSRALAIKESLLERHYAAVAARDEQGVSAEGPQEDGDKEEKEEQQQQQQQLEQLVDKVDVAATEDEHGINSKSDVMSEEEVNALVNFKASSSWIRDVAKKFGWKMELDRKDFGSHSIMNVDHSEMNIAEDGTEQYIVAGQEDQDDGLSDAHGDAVVEPLEEQEPLDYIVDEHNMLVLNEDEPV